MFGGSKPNSLTCPECGERYTCSESYPNNAPRIQCAFRKEVDCLDNHLVLMQYANGVKVSYNECHYTPDDNREYVFIGTKGKLKLDDAAGKLFVRIRKSAREKDYMEYTPGGLDGGHGGGDPRLFIDLANAIDRRTQPLAGAQAGLDAIRVGLLAHESIRQGGKPIKIK
jgi:predicted dehydrogenase